MKKLLILWTEFPQSKTESSLNTFSDILTSFYDCTMLKTSAGIQAIYSSLPRDLKTTGQCRSWNHLSLVGWSSLSPNISHFSCHCCHFLWLWNALVPKYFTPEDLPAKYCRLPWALTANRYPFLPSSIEPRLPCRYFLKSQCILCFFSSVSQKARPCFNLSSILDLSPSAKTSRPGIFIYTIK